MENKMNLSRFTYFESFINNIIALNKTEFKNRKPEIIEEIDFQIRKIYEKQKGGYWSVTDGDKVFIKYLEKVKNGINGKNHIELIKEILKDAYNNSEKKLKVVFFAQEISVWPSFESIYMEMASDDRFITELVYIPFVHPNATDNSNNYNVYKEIMMLPILNHHEYNLSKSSPDVSFFLKPYDLIPREYQVHEIDKVVRRIVYIRYGFEIANWNIKYHFQMPLQYKAWKFIVYGEPIAKLAKEFGYKNAENVVAWGHPRSDYYNMKTYIKNDFPDKLIKKIKGRKVILWNTQHTIQDEIGGGTFFKWKEELFEYFSNKRDLFLLWRPHPLMFGAIVNGGYMTSMELDDFVEKLNHEENVFIDTSLDYRNSFYISDAIITDGTAFLVEYLYTDRPIIYTPKGNSIYFFREFCDSLYLAEEEGDLVKFVEMIDKNKDPKISRRLKLKDYLLTKQVNGVGNKIKDSIFCELINEEKNAFIIKRS